MMPPTSLFFADFTTPTPLLRSQYAKQEFTGTVSCCFSPFGCMMMNLSNFMLEYNDDEAMPLDSLLDKRIGDICSAKGGEHTLKIKYNACAGFGVCCMLVGCCTKPTSGYGDPRKTVPWLSMDPAKEWPLTAPGSSAPKQQVMEGAGMNIRAVPVEAAPKGEAGTAAAV